MNRFLPLVVLLCIAAAPSTSATAPTTAPTTAAAIEMLDQGRVRITPPAGWTLVERARNGLSLRYALGDGTGTMTIVVTPQDTTLQPDAAARMAKTIGQQLREAARNTGAQMLIPPRVEPDERFFLKVRDRTRGADGLARDQLQIYRAMNLELVHVAAVATVPKEEDSQPIFAAAEELLDSAKLGTGPKPTTFRKTRVRLTIPTDWVEQQQRPDDPNGVVATYTNPAFPGARLVVRSKVIPKDAKLDPQVREHTLDELVDAYRHASAPDGATKVGEERKVEHPIFKRYVLRSLTWNDQPWGTDFRCVVAGDVAIGVEALVPPRDTQIDRLADAMALSIRSLDDKGREWDLKVSQAVPPAARQMRRPTTGAAGPAPTTSPSRTTDTTMTTTPRPR